MLEIIIRVMLGILGTILGLYIAFKEGKGRKTLGILIITVSVLQGLEKTIDLSNILKDYFIISVPYTHKLSNNDKTVQIFNQEGKLLWMANFDDTVNNVILEDIDNDGYKELTVGVGGDSKDTGKILLYGRKGEKRWVFDTISEYPYRGGGSSRKLSIKNLKIESFKGKTVPRKIVAISGDVRWYQSKVVVLDAGGKLLGEYWHPGQLGPLVVEDMDNDGITEIVVAGNNNDFRQTIFGDGSDTNFHCVFLLKMSEVKGEAPPYYGKLGFGTQKWYKIILPQDEPFKEIEVKDFNGDGRLEVAIWLKCGYVYYLNYDGKIIKQGIADDAECNPQKTGLLDIPEKERSPKYGRQRYGR